MKPRIIVMTLLISALLFLVGTQAWAEYGNRLGHRQLNQFKRIGDGLRKGELTKWEYRKLTREQWRIQRAKQWALADGWVDRYERARLNRLQNRASRHIFRTKHNRAVQKPLKVAWGTYCPPRVRRPAHRPGWVGYHPVCGPVRPVYRPHPRPPVRCPWPPWRGYYFGLRPWRPYCAPHPRPPVSCPRPGWTGYSFGFGGYVSDPTISFGWSVSIP